MALNKIIKLLQEEDGEYHEEDTFMVYGNQVDPKVIIIFEKRCIFEIMIPDMRHPIDSARTLLISTFGVPSKKCLNFISKLKAPTYYMGDLDPTSFYAYLTIKYLKRRVAPTDKVRFPIKFLGLTMEDIPAKPDISIKLQKYELEVLEYIKQFKTPELKKELDFLTKTSGKIEADGIYSVNKAYLKNKILKTI
jgi:DNA topoisomerase VI subunit A